MQHELCMGAGLEPRGAQQHHRLCASARPLRAVAGTHLFSADRARGRRSHLWREMPSATTVWPS
eukprot:5015060-Pleurochrysis_carterae.AAC.6